MYDLKEALRRDRRIRKVPNSTEFYGPNKTRIRDIKTSAEAPYTAQIWVEGKLEMEQINLFLSVLFGQFVSEYTSRYITSTMTDRDVKDETEITLEKIPAIIVIGTGKPAA